MGVNSRDFNGNFGRIFISTITLGNDKFGAENDIAFQLINSGLGGGMRANLSARKGGTWTASLMDDATDSMQIALPYRSLSMVSADLLPGWRLAFEDSYATSTVPKDLYRVGTFGGAWYASVSGTKAHLGRGRSGSVSMPFFSAKFTITALPEATRFLWFGQFYTSGNNIYGYGLRIDSTGATTLRVIDPSNEPTPVDTALATGMTVAVNDTIVLERFGWRMSVAKTAGVGRQLLGAENGTSGNRPLHAELKASEGFATSLASNSFGLATDSTSVRISNVSFSG